MLWKCLFEKTPFTTFGFLLSSRQMKEKMCCNAVWWMISRWGVNDSDQPRRQTEDRVATCPRARSVSLIRTRPWRRCIIGCTLQVVVWQEHSANECLLVVGRSTAGGSTSTFMSNSSKHQKFVWNVRVPISSSASCHFQKTECITSITNIFLPMNQVNEGLEPLRLGTARHS